MAAPSTYNQLELGSTTYTDLVELRWMPGASQSLVHICPNSVVHPSKWYGRGPATLEGILQCTGANQTGFLTALQTQTERHAAWVGPNAVAVYVHVNAAEITSIEYVAGAYGSPDNTKLTRVGFSFVCPDQRLYLYSDNSVLVGA